MSEPVVRGRDADESDHLHAGVQLVLRLGILLSVTLMVAGLAVRFVRGGEDAPAVDLSRIFAPGNGADVVLTALGILVLALTPAFRVLALVWLWARERDYRFVVVALVVVGTLTASVFLGKGG